MDRVERLAGLLEGERLRALDARAMRLVLDNGKPICPRCAAVPGGWKLSWDLRDRKLLRFRCHDCGGDWIMLRPDPPQVPSEPTAALPPHLAAAPSEAVASERRREHHAPPTPPTPPPPPCWKCGGPIGKAAWSLPFVLQHAPDGGLDTRLVCGPCRDAMYLWVNADNEASTVREMADEDARAREDARKERRRRVLLGLERGDDPQLVGGVCSPWTFDPWRRG